MAELSCFTSDYFTVTIVGAPARIRQVYTRHVLFRLTAGRYDAEEAGLILAS